MHQPPISDLSHSLLSIENNDKIYVISFAYYVFIKHFNVSRWHWNMYICVQGVKKGLQALRGYSVHLIEQKSPSQHMNRHQCLQRDMSNVCVISIASHAFKHVFQPFVAQMGAFCWKFLVPLESPNRHSLLIAIISLSHWWALKHQSF
jgi:hypothetical protein